MAYQLLTKYASDSAVKAIVDKYDFYITPIVNPDGEPQILTQLSCKSV